MKSQSRWLLALLLFVSLFARGAVAESLRQMDFTVDGVPRSALVYLPASTGTNGAPVVFVFHGHGGNARQAARSFGIERHWPEAMVVYMQGLNTPGRLTDPQGKLTGWQSAVGDQGDRDLKFFDAVLARLKKENSVDAKRIYCTGHSNGGGFTYLLWLARGEVFAAVAPSAAAAKFVKQLAPKPALHLAGENDSLVKFAWQELTMAAVRQLNGCAAPGAPWAKQCTIYPSTNGTPLVTCIYPGGHQFNPAAPALMVKFFKEHPGESGK